MSISIVIHTYNSEKYLEECLQSVSSADEIIICDMYSTDRTVEIAQKFGCKIIYHENLGYADPARNFALSHATKDWTLVLDSDEIVPEKLMKYFRSQIEQPNCPDVFLISRKNLVFGKFMHCLYPNQIIRFFRTGFVTFDTQVHCTPNILKGTVYKIDPQKEDLALIHYNYDSVEAFITRTNRYTTLELEKLLERNFRFTFKYFFLRPLGEFFKRYLLKGGYKDGVHGFIVSYLLAMYKAIAIIKLWEHEKNT